MYFEGEIIPVMKSESDMIIRPYIDENVKVGRYFYDYESDNNKQENSLILYENIYMQNTGVDYINNSDFDVVSILDGEVITVNANSSVNVKYTLKCGKCGKIFTRTYEDIMYRKRFYCHECTTEINPKKYTNE